MSFLNLFSSADKDKKEKALNLEEQVRSVFENPPTLETERLKLCRIVPEHASDMFLYSSDPDVTKYLTWSPHSCLKETERYLQILQKKYAEGSFNDWGVIEKSTGRFIGTCGYTSFDFDKHTAEVGYVLAKDIWGKGYATEAVKKVMHYGVDTFALEGFCAKHMQGNDASGRVMQKCGMTLQGVYRKSMYIKGEFKDIVVYAVSTKDFLEKEATVTA